MSALPLCTSSRIANCYNPLKLLHCASVASDTVFLHCFAHTAADAVDTVLMHTVLEPLHLQGILAKDRIAFAATTAKSSW